MKKIWFISALALVSGYSQAAVWDTTTEWTQRAEARYSEWLSTRAPADLFASGGRLSVPLVPTAIPYAYRAYFSYQNGLPFIMRSRTRENVFLSNEMDRWDTTEAGDRRFAQFLYDLVAGRRPLANLSEDALWRASFPIRMDEDSLQPGVFYLRYRPAEDPEARTEMYLLREADYRTRVPSLEYFASQYRSIQLTRQLSTRRVVLPEQPSGLSGYLAFRWPNLARDGFQSHEDDNRFDPRDQRRDAFTPNEVSTTDTFSFRVFAEMGRRELRGSQKLGLEVDDLCARMNNRKDWVNAALEHLNQERQLDDNYVVQRGTPAWRALSTTLRDQRLRDDIREVYAKYVNASLNEVRDLGRRRPVRRQVIEQEMQACRVQWGANASQSIDLLEFAATRRPRSVRRAMLDPNSSLAARWAADTLLP